MKPTEASDIQLIRDFVANKVLVVDARGYVKSRESSKLDFKQSFNWANAAEYTKTMVSFANNQGGYLVFGVKDKPREMLGLTGDSFDNLTSEKISEFLKSYFSSTLDYEFETLNAGNQKIGWIYTRPALTRPVICIKNSGKELKDGVIYYRNGARSETIGSSDLQQILAEQKQRESDRWMRLFETASRIGVENAAMLNLDSGVVSAAGGSVVIDESILDKIKFIKEGEFNEKVGAPALRIVGSVQAGVGKIIEKPVDAEIKFPLTAKELGLQLGFSPESSASANAQALIKYYKLQVEDVYMHTFNIGKGYKKYSQEVVELLRQKANSGEYEIDKDSSSMKKIRKAAHRL